MVVVDGVPMSGLVAEAEDPRAVIVAIHGGGELLWHPERLYPSEVLTGITVSPAAPAYEDQMVSDWARQNFAALAPAVRVPVQFSIAEYERVWQTDPPALSEIGAPFTGCPRFTVDQQPEAGHNISLGHTAGAYHSKVFAFADECVTASGSATPARNSSARSVP
ncbi:hypothetical protein AWC15_11665 [Mycobacterium lacus]|nr:hypothetical protein AWC15_11665 [Mycobacterium lacus]